MIIGIDARPLCSEKPTGISNYLINILSRLNDNENLYILYSDKKIKYTKNFNFNYKIKYYKAKISTIYLFYKLPKMLLNDKVDVFWGTEHILPKVNKKIKTVLTVHDIALLINPFWGSFKNALMQRVFCTKSIKLADKIISVSNSTKNELINRLNVNGDKIKVIHLGFSSDKGADLYEADSKYILFIGSLDKRKNVYNIVRGFNYFVNMYSSCYKLIIVGGNGNDSKRIISYIKKNKLENKVILKGYVDKNEKRKLLSNCEFLLFPSNYEGFGLPILEAYSYGKIALVANNSSLIEVAGDFAPAVSDSRDYKEIARSINIIINFSDEKKERLREICNERINMFSWDKSSKETIDYILDWKW